MIRELSPKTFGSCGATGASNLCKPTPTGHSALHRLASRDPSSDVNLVRTTTA